MERRQTREPNLAVAYYRTSSATNVGEDKDSLRRQREAVEAFARRKRIEIVDSYYDAAVSGADPIDERPGFSELLARIRDNGVSLVLVEDPTRFARDLAVQLTGHELLRSLDVELIPVNAPDFFTEDTPTAVLVRQILGAVSQFQKAHLVRQLRLARDRKRETTGRCEGRKPVPAETVTAAKRLARKNRKTGKRPSLRHVSSALAEQGHVGPSGAQYGPESIKRMLV